jgi:hypothetical protein
LWQFWFKLCSTDDHFSHECHFGSSNFGSALLSSTARRSPTCHAPFFLLFPEQQREGEGVLPGAAAAAALGREGGKESPAGDEEVDGYRQCPLVAIDLGNVILPEKSLGFMKWVVLNRSARTSQRSHNFLKAEQKPRHARLTPMFAYRKWSDEQATRTNRLFAITKFFMKTQILGVVGFR